jgi:hypothetical protein
VDDETKALHATRRVLGTPVQSREPERFEPSPLGLKILAVAEEPARLSALEWQRQEFELLTSERVDPAIGLRGMDRLYRRTLRRCIHRLARGLPALAACAPRPFEQRTAAAAVRVSLTLPPADRLQ